MDTLDGLSKAMDESKEIYWENKLLSYMVVTYLIIGSVLVVAMGNIWKIPLVETGSVSIFMIIGAILTLNINRIFKNDIYIRHCIGLTLDFVSFSLFKLFYDDLGPLFWMVPIIIIITSTFVVTNYIILQHNILSTVILVYYAVNYITLKEVYIDGGFNFALIIIMFYLMTSIGISNKVHQYVNIKKIEFYCQNLHQSEEIATYYEELIAADENMKAQNEELSIVNKELKDLTQALEKMAYFDELTGLPNRRRIYSWIEELIISSKGKEKFAVAFIDIDNFKKVNDTLGHTLGDTLLIEISKRMTSVKREWDLLGRLGGDEMALVIRNIQSKDDLRDYIQQFLDTFNQSFQLANDIYVDSNASIGIALYPQDALERESILKFADMAMYKAKENGKKRYVFYDSEFLIEILNKSMMEDKLQIAIENEEFFLVYQPLYRALDSKLYGFEALVRWRDDAGRVYSPLEFIPLAEESGHIKTLGLWILREACKAIRKIFVETGKMIHIAVNVSAIQFQQQDFVEEIRKIMNETQIPDGTLEIEITESVLIDDKDNVIRMLESIKALGIKISLDDFGTGYSSLNYLMDLPIDKIKIDKTFIDFIGKDSNKEKLISAIIGLGKIRQADIVAEGVETKDQLVYLGLENCNYVQGYFLGKPMSYEEIEKLL